MRHHNVNRKFGRVRKERKALLQENPADLLREVEETEKRFLGHYLTLPRDRTLAFYHKSLGLLKKLCSLEMSKSEFEGIRKNRELLRTKEIAQFVVQETGKPIVVSKRWETYVQSAVKFYETAARRDQAIRQAVKSFQGSQGSKTAVLVFGGFHAQSIKEILKEENVSYDIVAPAITQEDTIHQKRYQSLMTEGVQPFKLTQNPAEIALTVGQTVQASRYPPIYVTNRGNPGALEQEILRLGTILSRSETRGPKDGRKDDKDSMKPEDSSRQTVNGETAGDNKNPRNSLPAKKLSPLTKGIFAWLFAVLLLFVIDKNKNTAMLFGVLLFAVFVGFIAISFEVIDRVDSFLRRKKIQKQTIKSAVRDFRALMVKRKGWLDYEDRKEVEKQIAWYIERFKKSGADYIDAMPELVALLKDTGRIEEMAENFLGILIVIASGVPPSQPPPL
jgi:hypothetical protein